MKRTFTIETSEADERALHYAHRAEGIDFAFNSILVSVVNSARDQNIRDAKENAQKTGEFLPADEDTVILASKLPDADSRHAKAVADAEIEAAERAREEQDRLARLKAEEDERIRQAVAAALAERDAQQGQGDLFTEVQP